MEDLKFVTDFDQTADISQQLKGVQAEKAELSEAEYQQALIRVAETNAFDVNTTLKAIELLNQTEIDSQVEYDLLREALEVNRKSTDLWEAYIYSCAKNNFTAFGETALDQLSELADQQKVAEVRSEFEQILEEKTTFQIR